MTEDELANITTELEKFYTGDESNDKYWINKTEEEYFGTPAANFANSLIPHIIWAADEVAAIETAKHMRLDNCKSILTTLNKLKRQLDS